MKMEKKKEKNDKSLLYLEQFLVSARKERKVIIVCKYAKGQKSSKAFFLGTPLPKKRTIYLTKFGIILSYISFIFWARSFKKKCF